MTACSRSHAVGRIENEASIAEIRIQDGDIIVQLGSLEKIGALHGDVRVPRSAVIAMRVVENPFAEIQGIRFQARGFQVS